MAKKRKKPVGWKAQMLLIFMLFAGIIFSALSIVLAVGMIPTLVAAIVDRSKGRIKTMTIGLMNFAGCAPFLIEVWRKGDSIEIALTYIAQPRTIVVIYFAAGMGYLIDWAVTGIVSSIMAQRAKGRLKDIQEHQKLLIERWGPEVNGTIALDDFGFPLEGGEATPGEVPH